MIRKVTLLRRGGVRGGGRSGRGRALDGGVAGAVGFGRSALNRRWILSIQSKEEWRRVEE